MLPIIDEQALFQKMASLQNPYFEEYYAFYSSWFGGIIKNPRFMLLPIDDHMVHRGDGVFETMKAVNRSVYLMDRHLQRLGQSAEKIALPLPCSIHDIQNIILETLRVANQDQAAIRLFLSRGPGNFSVDPYDAIASQLYIVITKLKPPMQTKYEMGTVIGKSNLTGKPSWMAQIKSCNYLPNVLMKKEAVDRDLDFVVGANDQGHITESATENIMIVNQQGVLVHPSLNIILKGTTLSRVCELAQSQGIAVQAKPITVVDIYSAREAMITGTSLNVLPVVTFEGQPIGNGQPGPITKQLNMLMLKDIAGGKQSTFF